MVAEVATEDRSESPVSSAPCKGCAPGRKIDLFEKIPFLKRFCKWRGFPFVLILPCLLFFEFFLVAGVLGSPVGNRNIMIIFVWILWWFMLITFLVPFVGRIWCAVCPFPFFGDWLQRRTLLRVRSGKTGALRNKMFGLSRKWPKVLSNMWIGNIFFLVICTFSAHLLTRPIVSVLILGGLFLIATVLAVFFRQRAFCLYVCPVSGFQGLYAMTATMALRPKDRTVCNRLKPGLDYSFDSGIAPCRLACPAGVDTSGYISLIKEKDYDGAIDLIHEALPFASVCGRVCHHPCESQCLRGEIDQPVSICKLKRFVAGDSDGIGSMPQATEPRFTEKVAIVGGGPGGLTCAYQLARQGYQVEVFESHPVAGGMLRLAIPDYRLPQEVVDREVDFIERTGVKINTGVEIGKDISFQDLREQHQAVLVCVGASKSRGLEIEGEDRAGVLNAIDFLRSIKLQEQEKVRIGRRVLVIGGGDTAVDSARASLRLGASEVTIVYRRGREQMPAVEEEIQAAEAEGIRLETLSLPLKILGENGSASSLLCTRMKLVESDESGRPRPVPIAGSEYEIKADTVIIATGQYSDISFLPEEMAIVDGTRIVANEETCATNIPGLFAAGDVVTGPSMLIYAIASGNKAAQSIHRYLRGEEIVPVSLHPTDTGVEELPLGITHKAQRALPDLIDVADRRGSFREVEQVFTEKTALEEAGRCLSCGICGDCYRGTDKGWACPWFQSMGGMERNNYCGLCMECVKSCPNDNIGLFLRPFGSDTHMGGLDESWKAFIMLGLAAVYSVVLLGPWGLVKEWANVAETGNWKGFAIYAGTVWIWTLVAIPALWLAGSWLGKKLSGTDAVSTREMFLRSSYMLVPFGLLAWIAFSFPLIVINGAYIVSTLSDPLGHGWDLFGTANVPWTPILPEYVVFVQIPLLLFGLGIALKRGHQIAQSLYGDKKRALRSIIPLGLLCGAFTALFVRLFTG